MTPCSVLADRLNSQTPLNESLGRESESKRARLHLRSGKTHRHDASAQLTRRYHSRQDLRLEGTNALDANLIISDGFFSAVWF